MKKGCKKGFIGCFVCVALLVAFCLWLLHGFDSFMPHNELRNAKFHNSKEISEFYHIDLPPFSIIDSTFAIFDRGDEYFEYYTNTYSFSADVSIHKKENAVKILNDIDELSGNVEAKLLNNGLMEVKFQFNHDRNDEYNMMDDE